MKSPQFTKRPVEDQVTQGPKKAAFGNLGPLARLHRRFLRKYRGLFAICLLGLLAQSFLLLPVPILQGRVVDYLIEAIRNRASSGADWNILLSGLWPIAVILTLQIARSALSWWVGVTMGRVSQEVVVELRSALHAKLMNLSLSFYDAHQTGRLMARVTSDVGSILSFVNSGLLQLVNDLLLSVGIAIVLVYLEWRLALVAIVVLPLYTLNHRFFARKLHQLSQAIRSQVSAIYALLGEKVSAIRVVRAFAQEGSELATLDARIDKHRKLSWDNTRTGALLSMIATLISGLGTVTVLILGTLLVVRGEMTVGSLLAFYSLVGQLYGPIVRLTQFQTTALATCVSVERIFEILDEPETITEAANAVELKSRPVTLEYRNVSFQYREDAPIVLDQISFRVTPGMTLGVLGPSGAGKSSLLSLAPRLYDATSGAILLNGVDVRNINHSDLHNTVMLVPQRSQLFEGTIGSNLTYAAPDASVERQWIALEIANLAETVRGLSLGLETPVGERGFTLSGGQRQRLALARAILAEPAILLLDDCTSALDAETEANIQEALDVRLSAITRVIVSHKASSVSRADWILVLDQGKIVEQGTHEELLECRGHYAANYEAQVHALGAA